ncbi:MAG: serpin family protein [Firmicutes bacterium]|nr:serpin family protein [Bacillota bacterium]
MKIMMKRLLTVVLALAMVFAMAACGQNSEQTQGTPTPVDTPDVNTDVKAVELTADLTAEEPDPEKVDEYFDAIWDNQDSGSQVRIASFELFKKLAGEDVSKAENTLISPLSFMVAMGMLENGTQGDSLEEIEKAFGIDIGDFNDWYDAWYKLIKTTSGDALNIANSVWYRNDGSGLKVEDGFLSKMALLYRAKAYSAAFDDSTAADMNNWVKDNTDGMIDKIVDSLNKDDQMMLINATCFEGQWFQDYEGDQITENETFTREDGSEDKVVMLHSLESENTFYSTDLFTGTKKAYKNGFQIVFLLPNEGKTVAEVIDSLSGEDFSSFGESSMVADVELTIPEFSFDYEAKDAISALNEMGIHTVFDDEKADLSPMAHMETGENLYVSKIIHKTHIELDREGTKAAAVTGIGIANATAIMENVPKVELRLDRPFIFAICDSNTNIPVFLGTVQGIN